MDAMDAVRGAKPADAPELVRLRAMMFEAMGVPEADTAWRGVAERQLRTALADAESGYGIFVIDDPERAGRLAACAVGTLERRLAAPKHPEGLFGFVFNVCVEPRWRRRGWARACTRALLGWFDERGATRLDLHATAEAEGLYRDLGFAEHSIALSREARAVSE
jgi:ribosomal protein S18 acetylase RimI-like enzyme